MCPHDASLLRLAALASTLAAIEPKAVAEVSIVAV
jgi:hypothetical protein